MSLRTISAIILTGVLLLVQLQHCSRPVNPLVLHIPATPVSNDSSYSIKGLRSWYLSDNAVDTSHSELSIRISTPPAVTSVHAFLDSADYGRCARDTGSVFTLHIPVGTLSCGVHDLILAEEGADSGFAWFTFIVTQPLFVVVSNDWETPDVSWSGADNTALTLQEQLHADHPGLLLTYFVGPYTFTSSAITPERRAVLVEWLNRMKANFGDEIGLHIHGRCEFVSAIGLPCRMTPLIRGITVPDSTGYMTSVAAYPYEEFRAMLAASDSLFLLNGLPIPRSFRAGGWSAGPHTLRALANAGYRVDASAVNWRLFVSEQETSDTISVDIKHMWWNIRDTSQPYYPYDPMSGQLLDILEVPDNAVLADQVDVPTMVRIFKDNWPGGALSSPRQLSIGYHPVSMTVIEFGQTETNYEQIDRMLAHTDSFSIATDRGPVVYARMCDMRLIW